MWYIYNISSLFMFWLLHYPGWPPQVWLRAFLIKRNGVEGNQRCLSSGLPPYKTQGNHRKSSMVIYENIKDIESTIEIYGNMQVSQKDHTIVRFYASRTLYHSMAKVLRSMREFFEIMITYSSEQKFDLKYSWKTLQ